MRTAPPANAAFAMVLTGGTQTAGVVRCEQPRALDFVTRRPRKLKGSPAVMMDDHRNRNTHGLHELF